MRGGTMYSLILGFIFLFGGLFGILFIDEYLLSGSLVLGGVYTLISYLWSLRK